MLRRFGWRLLAFTFVTLGLIGAALPGLPSTVFMLLAVWAAGKGWPPLAHWLRTHPRFGPPIRNWQEQGAVSRRAKWLAAISMLVSVPLIYLTAPTPWLAWLLPGIMLLVLLWLCTRPEPPRKN